jgi:DNA polymerase III epsilon subunit-like protein
MIKPAMSEQQKIKEAASQWAKERLADSNTVIIDIESTGLLHQDPDTEIAQISIINVKGRPLFSMLLKPNKPMGEVVMDIHKITNDDVFNQPVFPQIAKIIAFILQDKHVVCYNADFDIRLLWHMFKKYDQKLPEIAGASCAMDRYSEWCGEWNKKRGGFKWQRLPTLGYGMSHDALTDCQSTLKVMEKMANKFDPSRVEIDEIDLNF